MVKAECAQQTGKLTLEIESLKKDLEQQKAETAIVIEENRSVIAELNEVRSVSDTNNAAYARNEKKSAEIEAERIAENIILSGNLIPRYCDGEDTINVALSTFKSSIRVSVNRSDVALAYRPKKKLQDKYVYDDKIVIKFHSKPSKRDIVHSNLKFKPKGLFINEQLTKRVDEFYYHLRKIKKEQIGKIATLYTRDGVIHVRKTKEGSLYKIVTEQEFNSFLNDAQLPSRTADTASAATRK